MFNFIRYSSFQSKTLQCCGKEICIHCYANLDNCPYCNESIERSYNKCIVIRDNSQWTIITNIISIFIWSCISFLIIMVPILINSDSDTLIIIGLILTFILTLILTIVFEILLYLDKIPCIQYIY